MNKITKKLILSVLTVILAVGALGTTTFAWFTLSNVAKVSTFNADIVGEYGIEISLDGDNWHNTINEQMIKDYLFDDEDYEFKFNHITTEDGFTFEKINGEHVIEEENTTTNILINKSYLEFNIYFKSLDMTKINLTEIGLFGTDFTWEADVTYDYSPAAGTKMTKDDPIEVNPINALRIALTSKWGLDEELLDTEELLKAYERASHTTEDEAANTYMGDTYVFTNNMAAEYYFAKNDEKPGKVDTRTLVGTVAVNTNLQNNTILASGNYAVLELEKQTGGDHDGYYVGILTVKVWLEGFDAEAFNAILGLPVSFALKFEGSDPVQP